MLTTAAPATRQIPVPAGFRQLDDITRYQTWLEEAYRTAISDSVRCLVAEVSNELESVRAVGLDADDDFVVVVHRAVRSVASALDHEVQGLV